MRAAAASAETSAGARGAALLASPRAAERPHPEAAIGVWPATSFLHLCAAVRAHPALRRLLARSGASRALQAAQLPESYAVPERVLGTIDTIAACLQYVAAAPAHGVRALPPAADAPPAPNRRRSARARRDAGSSSEASVTTTVTLRAPSQASDDEGDDDDEDDEEQEEFSGARGASPPPPPPTTDARELLHRWFYAHLEYPYPSEAQKEALMREASLTLQQVNDFFGNKRMRMKRRVHRMRASGFGASMPPPPPPASPGEHGAGGGRGATWQAHIYPFARIIVDHEQRTEPTRRSDDDDDGDDDGDDGDDDDGDQHSKHNDDG